MHRAVEVAGGRKMLGCTKQHGGVPVMAAGVMLAVTGRLPGHAGAFLHVEGIEVGTQTDRARTRARPDRRHHTGFSDALVDLVDTKTAQPLDHIGSGADLFEGGLGIGMDMPAPLGHLGQIATQLFDRCNGFDGAHVRNPG